MSTGAKIILAVVGSIVLLIGGCGVWTVGTYNGFISQEKGVQAQYEQNKNNYDNMWKKFKEVSQVPGMYTEDLKKVYDSAIQGRYGDQGSQAMFQWLKEHNPDFDSAMYTKIQQVVLAILQIV